VPSGLPAYFASLYEVPLLTREQEAHLFWKMNYLKYKASGLRDELECDRPKSHLMDQIEKLYDESVAIRNQIIRANLRLVVSTAKRYMTPAHDIFELVSDGNMSLIRAVEKFDVSRGTMFFTYATVAIVNDFAHTISVEVRHRDRFLTSHTEILSNTETSDCEPHVKEAVWLWRESYVKQVLRCLDERELQIITGRFGLSRSQRPLTLKQLGAAIGVCKDRIRQIQCRAIRKLRKAVEDDHIDFDEALAGPCDQFAPAART
jgi:RNA polymerase primary sigma factor/RNA polymerase sigma factor